MAWDYAIDGAEISFDVELLDQIEQKCNDKVQLTLNITKKLSNAIDVSGASLLHYAANYGNEDLVQFLITSGAKINLKNKDGNTPLLLATKEQHTSTIKVLLESDADIYISDRDGKSALEVALNYYTNIEIAKLFLHKINNECLSDSTEIAKILMKMKCPLYLAVILKNVDLTMCMLTKPYWIDARDCFLQKNALHFAVENSDLANVKKLVFFNIDVNAKDRYDRTPLALLEDFSNPEEALSILDTLIKAKADLTSCDNFGSMQIRPVLQNGAVEAVKMVLKSCYDKTAENKQNFIHYLAKNCNPGIVEFIEQSEFLESINVNARDKDGFTALHFAVSAGNTNYVKYLIKKNVNQHILTDTAVSPFIYAIESDSSIENRRQCIEILLQNGGYPEIFLGHYFEKYDTKSTINRDYVLLEPIIAALSLREILGQNFNREIFQKINCYSKLKLYLDSCMNDFDRMKNEKIYKSVSLFDILTVNDNYKLTKGPIFFMSKSSQIEKLCKTYKSISFYKKILEDYACKKSEETLEKIGAGCVAFVILLIVFIKQYFF